MNETTNSSRRSFLKVGAVLATPVGAVAVPAIAAAADSSEARLAKLESEAAIRGLHQQWVRGINRGADRNIIAIVADHAGEPDLLQLSADGTRATGRYHCVIETVTELEPDCTLTQMKLAQGEHVVRDRARRVVVADYVRGEAGWAIGKVTLA
jgi:hypothetical protein